VPEHSSRSFKIYPNPVASELIIEATTPGQSMVSVALFDVLGKQVQVGAANSFPYTVNTGGLQEGSYLLRLMDEKGKVIFTQNVLKR
jgi:hypothetical protein